MRDRYRVERDKRLRADGNDQYVEVVGEFAHYTDDPYVESPIDRPPLTDEVDVIVVGHGVVAFCEVKARSSVRFGAPAEAVDRRRRERLRRAALEWLSGPGQDHAVLPVRFDVVGVLPDGLDRIEGAF